jgi:hypothetical protein
MEQNSKIKIQKEFSSEKKNSTIKEASASNMEETIAITTADLKGKLGNTSGIEPYRRAKSSAQQSSIDKRALETE